LVVLTLAFVATVIPKKPARPEQSAPTTNESATSGPDAWLPALARARRAATTTTKAMSTLYSLRRNARAPSAMWPAIAIIAGVPASCRPIQRARLNAYARASTPAPGTR
jgi:hypothetical protein